MKKLIQNHIQPEHKLLRAYLLNICSSNIKEISNNSDSQDKIRKLVDNGHVVSFNIRDTPNYVWADDEDKIETAEFVKTTTILDNNNNTIPMYTWKTADHDAPYWFHKNIATIRLWDEIDDQVSMFLRHFKCVLIDNISDCLHTNKTVNTLRNMIDNSYGNYISKPNNDKYYLTDRILNNSVTMLNEVPDYRTLDLFIYIKPQTITFMDYRKGPGKKTKMSVGDFYINYETEYVYQDSLDYLNRAIITHATHPHISQGNYCAGGWSAEWCQAKQYGRIYAYASAFAQFLRRYNSRSPYNSPEKFDLNYAENIEVRSGDGIEKYNYTFDSPIEAIKVRQKFNGRAAIILKRCAKYKVTPLRYIHAATLFNTILQAVTNIHHRKDENRRIRHMMVDDKSMIKRILEEFNEEDSPKWVTRLHYVMDKINLILNSRYPEPKRAQVIIKLCRGDRKSVV